MFELIDAFEERNNVSIRVAIFKDSYCVEEFWSEELINEGTNEDELKDFLTTAEYKKSHGDGRCLCPMQRIDKPAAPEAAQ